MENFPQQLQHAPTHSLFKLLSKESGGSDSFRGLHQAGLPALGYSCILGPGTVSVRTVPSSTILVVLAHLAVEKCFT